MNRSSTDACSHPMPVAISERVHKAKCFNKGIDEGGRNSLHMLVVEGFGNGAKCTLGSYVLDAQSRLGGGQNTQNVTYGRARTGSRRALQAKHAPDIAPLRTTGVSGNREYLLLTAAAARGVDSILGSRRPVCGSPGRRSSTTAYVRRPSGRTGGRCDCSSGRRALRLRSTPPAAQILRCILISDAGEKQ